MGYKTVSSMDNKRKFMRQEVEGLLDQLCRLFNNTETLTEGQLSEALRKADVLLNTMRAKLVRSKQIGEIQSLLEYLLDKGAIQECGDIDEEQTTSKDNGNTNNAGNRKQKGK